MLDFIDKKGALVKKGWGKGGVLTPLHTVLIFQKYLKNPKFFNFNSVLLLLLLGLLFILPLFTFKSSRKIGDLLGMYHSKQGARCACTYAWAHNNKYL